MALGPWRPPPGAFAVAADSAVTDVLSGSRAPTPRGELPDGSRRALAPGPSSDVRPSGAAPGIGSWPLAAPFKRTQRTTRMRAADSDVTIPTDGGTRPFVSTVSLHGPVAGHRVGGSHRALARGLLVASGPPGRRQVLALGPWRPPSRAHAWRLGFQVLDNGSVRSGVALLGWGQRHARVKRLLLNAQVATQSCRRA